MVSAAEDPFLHTEWALAREVLSPLWDLWFRQMVVLFATRFNHRLPFYVFPVADDMAWAVVALFIPWNNLLANAFPPFSLIGKILRMAGLDQVRLIQPWFQKFLSLSYFAPASRTLFQLRSGTLHGNPETLNLHS